MEINGHEIAETMYNDLRSRVAALKKKNVTPHLVVFLIGQNPASVAYVTLKQKRGEEIGAKVTVLQFDTNVTNHELAEKVHLLNNDPYVHAILIQRPLPPQIDIEKLELLTDPEKDIDGFHPKSPYILPLPLAVGKILEEIHTKVYTEPAEVSLRGGKEATCLPAGRSNLDIPTKRDPGMREDDKFISWLQSQNIVLIGKGPTGGGPIQSYLKTLHVTPTLIDSKTKQPESIMKKADIIISAVGREHVVTAENIKKGAILISVGILRGENNKLKGDYEVNDIKGKAAYYTPTPKGVGPVNVAKLMENLVAAAEKQAV